MSERVAIEGGGWFDVGRAQRYGEGTHWDGRNLISSATGQQFAHETLYRTAKGAWVLHEFSEWQGTGPGSYTAIDDRAAASWLVRNGHDVPDELTAVTAEAEL